MKLIKNKLETLYDRFILNWQRAKEGERLRLYVGMYTICFIVTFLYVFAYFFLEGVSFVWGADVVSQHYPLEAYAGRTLRRIFFSMLEGNFSIPLFDISIGSGDDIIGFFMGGTDPLLLLTALVPTAYSEVSYSFLIVFRIWLAGLSFSYLCFYFKKRKLHTLIGSMIYCFSGYAVIWSMHHPFFLNPLILLPLMIVGIDKILKKEKPYVFIMSMFYAVLCGYYHLYMMTIMIFIYALVRSFDLYEAKRCKELALALGRGVRWYLLGLGLGAIIFCPAAMEFFDSYRSGHQHYANIPWKAHLYNLVRLIAPPWDFNGTAFAAIVVFAFAILLVSNRRRTLKILVVTAGIFFTTNFGLMLMHAFQYPSYRWTFALVLVAAFTVVEMLPELLNLSGKQRILCIAILIGYTILCLFTGHGRNIKYFYMGAIFLALTLLVLTMNFGRVDRKWGIRTTADDYRAVACLLLVIFNVGMTGIALFAPYNPKWVGNSFGKGSQGVAKLLGDPIRDLEPYLSNNPAGRVDGTDIGLNRAMVWQIPDMKIYSSVGNKNVIEFWKKMEHNPNTLPTYINVTDNRSIVNTLFSGLYQVEKTNRSKEYIPYGYDEICCTKNGNNVYKNRYALPWGYTYERTISLRTLEGLNGLERQEAMLQAIALDDDTVGKLEKDSLKFDAKSLPYRTQYDGCNWRDGQLKVDRPNASITFLFNMPAGVEGYLRMQAFDINDSREVYFPFFVKCDDINKRSFSVSKKHVIYVGRENHLFNLGYSDKVRHSATITFPRPGTFKLKDIELYALPMTNYPARVNALRAEPLKNIEWGTNRLSGSVDLSRDKILCVSVPYSRGWSATVDGKEEKILRGNYMFMALPLKAGHHDIVFSYCSPGLKLGAALTVLSWGILAWMLIRERRRNGASSGQA